MTTLSRGLDYSPIEISENKFNSIQKSIRHVPTEYGENVPMRSFHHTASNGSTSVVGVRKIIKTIKKKLKDGSISEYKIPCLIAEIFLEVGEDYKKPKKSKSKIYSLNKYKEADAMLLAEVWRKEQEELLKKGR